MITLLFRKCKHCGQPPSWRRALILCLAIVANIWLWYYPTQRMGYWVGFLLLVYLGVVAVIDIEYRLILQPVSLVGAVLGLAIGTWIHSFWMTIAGGIAGFAIMFTLYYLGDVFARWLARRRGEELSEVALGYGDVMLSGVLGVRVGMAWHHSRAVPGHIVWGIVQHPGNHPESVEPELPSLYGHPVCAFSDPGRGRPSLSLLTSAEPITA